MLDTFAAAWEALAGVTTAHLTPERQQEAKEAVMAAMYPQGMARATFGTPPSSSWAVLGSAAPHKKVRADLSSQTVPWSVTSFREFPR